MIIRQATVKDAPAMGQVMVETHLSAHKEHMPEEAWNKRSLEWTPEISARSWEKTLREIEKAIKAGKQPDTCLYVAVDETAHIVPQKSFVPSLLLEMWYGTFLDMYKSDTIVGLIMGHPGEQPEVAAIGSIYVREEFQGQGIGRRLIQAAATYMAGIGFSSLQIGVLAANRPARQFYEAIGGKVVAEREFDEDGFLLPEIVYSWPNIKTLIKESP